MDPTDTKLANVENLNLEEYVKSAKNLQEMRHKPEHSNYISQREKICSEESQGQGLKAIGGGGDG